MSQQEIVTIDQVASFGDLIPAGNEFEARCSKGDLKTSSNNKPYLTFSFRVLAGEFEGLEFAKNYFLSYKRTNGKLYIRGIEELFEDMKAIGKPLPANQPIVLGAADSDGRGLVTNGQDLLKAVAGRLHPEKTPRIKVKSIAVPQQEKDKITGKYVDAYNDDGSKKMRTEYVVLGVPGQAPTHNLGVQATAIAGGSDPDEGSTTASSAIDFV